MNLSTDAEQRTGISWQIEDFNILRVSFANGTDPNNTADSSSHPLDECVLPICNLLGLR